jgi:hypothetical protein
MARHARNRRTAQDYDDHSPKPLDDRNDDGANLELA